MKKQLRILMLGLFVASVFSSVLWAEERTENRRRRQGEVRGAFVGLAEREFGEREHLAIVIKPLESDDYVAVLVPRKEDFLHAARSLQKGDKVEIGYVVEDEQKWVKKIGIERTRRIETERRREEIEERREVRRPPRERDIEERDRPRRPGERRREGERERPESRRPWVRLEQMEGQLKEIIAAHLGRMRREFRVLLNHVEQLEKQVQELRAENARLRRQLQMRERESSERGRERDVRARRDPEQRREARERAEAREREEIRNREEREKARRERAERREREEDRDRE
jgi:hypothetical protein